MEPNNPLPNNTNPTPALSSNLGSLSSQSQIFIHPEHEAGNLIVQSKPKTSFLKLEIFFSIIILVSIVITALLVFIAIPKTQAVTFANSTNEAVTASNDKTAKLNTSLEALYKNATNQTSSGITISDSSVDSSFVLGTSTKVSDLFSDKVKDLLINLKENFDVNSKVKAFSIPADDPNKASREMRQIAEDVGTKTAGVVETNKKLNGLVNSSVPQSAKTVQEDINKLYAKTQTYADQAKKTSNYYITLADSTIELTNLDSSLQNLKDIDLGISEITTLKAKFANYNQSALPEGLESYNKDVVDIFDALLTLFKQIQSGSLTSETAVLDAEESFVTKLEALNTSSTNHLIDFWQNNKSLSKGSDLASEHNDLLSEAKDLKNANNFFLLNLIGEN